MDILYIVTFAEVTENECVMHRLSHTSPQKHYLLIIIFKFNCKSNFTKIKYFCKLPLRWTVSFVFCSTEYMHDVVVKKFTFAVSSRDELLVITSEISAGGDNGNNNDNSSSSVEA